MNDVERTIVGLLSQVGLLGLATAVSSYVYASQVEPHALTLEQVAVPVKDLPAALEGFKIIQLSDIHLYPHTQLALVKKAVALANGRQPNLVVLTGDYVLQETEAIFELAPVLGGLNATHGVFAVQGNHDVKLNGTMVQRGLEEVGVPVLNNASVRLAVGRAHLYLAGVEDCIYGRPRIKRVVAEMKADAPAILLAHEPDFADLFAQNGRFALQLSGHTHGGQVKLPGIGPVILPRYGRKYHTGLYRVGEMWLYTNRGIGVGSIPIRFNCPPEITEITLVAAH